MKTLYLFLLSALLSIVPLFTYAQSPGEGGSVIVTSRSYREPDTPLPENRTRFNATKAGEDRIIYWVHGLGGNPASWDPVSGVTEVQAGGFVGGYPARRVLCLKPTYSPLHMNSAIADLQQVLYSKNRINRNSYDLRTDNFLIAHSQGGIVSRGTDRVEALDPLWTREFGGLVTFGTPHRGAAILNNGLPVEKGGSGKLQEFASGACTALASGPVLEAVDLGVLLNFLVSAFNLDAQAMNLTATGCEFFGGKILPLVLEDYQKNIVQSYKQGAPFLKDTLNLYRTTIPMVAFYGVEEAPEFWRVMNSLLEEPGNFSAFRANDDSTHLDYKTLKAHYVNKYLTFEAEKLRLSQSFGVPCTEWYDWIFNAPNCTFFNARWYKMHDISRKYREGVQWIDEANDKWRALIGARSTEIAYTTPLCNCADKCNSGANSAAVVSGAVECMELDMDPCLMCSFYTQIHTTVVTKPNDGIVTAGSAKDLPGAIVLSHLSEEDYKLKKTNHQQMRNNSELKYKLFGLLEGDYGLYFKTFER